MTARPRWGDDQPRIEGARLILRQWEIFECNDVKSKSARVKAGIVIQA